MTTTYPRRDNLYAKLREVLGNDNASFMMELLSTDVAQLATKTDVGALGSRMDRFEERMDRFEERMDRFEELMEKFDERLWDFHGALRTQTRVYATIVVTAMLGVGSLSFAAASLL